MLSGMCRVYLFPICTLEPGKRDAGVRQKYQHFQPASNAHKGKPCTPYALCGLEGQPKYTHPKDWQHKAAFAMVKSLEQAKQLEADSYICRLCERICPHVVEIPSTHRGG